jgi:hypothetical protein
MCQAFVSQNANVKLMDVSVEIGRLDHADKADTFKFDVTEVDFGELVSGVGGESGTNIFTCFGRESWVVTQVQFGEITEGL